MVVIVVTALLDLSAWFVVPYFPQTFCVPYKKKKTMTCVYCMMIVTAYNPIL